MGLLLQDGFVTVLCLIFLLLCAFYWYLTRFYNYWTKRGVVQKTPQFPYGSVKDIVLSKTFIGKGHDNIYKLFPNERFYGIIDFRKPALVVKDPDLIKKIMVKDFQHFMDRPIFMANPNEYIVLHLLNLTGKQWKDMRTKLTPTFSSGKLKSMFDLMEDCSKALTNKLDRDIESGQDIDAKDILARFTMDTIASCAFGLEANSHSENEMEFYRLFQGVTKTTKLRFIRRIFIFIFPAVIRILRINLIRPELRDFITNLIRNTIEYREKHSVNRNDFLNLLINIKKNKEEREEEKNENNTVLKNSKEVSGLTLEQMAAQTFVFFVAGFETASSLMTFCLYELSRHPHIQEQLYNDVMQAVENNGGKISYQTLSEIPFLDQVINETLRLYGTAQVLSRVCTKAYKIPDSEVVIEKGNRVIIPLYSLHHDPTYYPDPYEFKPERFTPEETMKRHPFVFMPFGEGPRNCIGMRFGLMQAKVGLSTIVMNYQVRLSPDQEVPIEIDNRSVVLLPANPVLLKMSKRDP